MKAPPQVQQLYFFSICSLVFTCRIVGKVEEINGVKTYVALPESE